MAGERESKVYEYDKTLVREALVKGFKQRNAESTVADLAGLTGLPLNQIEAQLPAVADEFGGRLKVTEKGEILYSFPDGMKSRLTGFGPSLRRFFQSAKRVAITVAKTLFKVWIMGMLVGYFVLFLALALFAMLASIAMQQGGNGRSSNRRGGGLGGIWLTGRLFDSLIRIWFYSELFKTPEQRSARSALRKERHPLHKAVFSHVFGDGDPNQNWAEIEKKAVIAFLQTHKGLMTMTEFMAITGQDPLEAELSINRYLLEFEGLPEVSTDGTLYFSFPKLLSRLGTTPEILATTIPLKKTMKFSSNAAKTDTTFRLVNIFNLAFGGYFLSNAIAIGAAFYVQTAKGLALRGGFPFVYSATGYLFQLLGSENPVPSIFWGLGITPILFSTLFFAIPIIRSIRQNASNEAIKTENLRRIVYRTIVGSNGSFKPESISVSIEEAKPKNPDAVEKIADRLAAWSRAEPMQSGYVYKEIERAQKDIEALRATIDTKQFAPGATVFDTKD